MEIPNLSGAITKDDIKKKGGSFKADYIPWAKTQKILSENAPGWFFNMEPAPDGTFIWKTPKDSGFIMGYFQKDNYKTPLFPYAITDHTHKAISYKNISSKEFCNNHRRALCATACYTFNLAYELWAQIEIKEEEEQEVVKEVVEEVVEEIPDTLFDEFKKTYEKQNDDMKNQIFEHLEIKTLEDAKTCGIESVNDIISSLKEE